MADKWPARDYIPYVLAHEHTEREKRAEYTRMRDIAQKRIKRMQKSEWSNTEWAKRYSDGWKKLKDIKNAAELDNAIADIHHFLEMKQSRVSGFNEIREKNIKKLHASGYDFVNKKNWRAFAQFMDQAKSAAAAVVYDSKDAALFYEEIAEKKDNKMSAADVEKAFKSWLRKQKSEQKIRHKNPRGSDFYDN